MSKQFYADAFGWGFALWSIGYILGFLFFFIVPASLIGWVIMPFGIAATLLVLYKKVKGDSMRYFLSVAICWTLIAVVFDNIFLVRMLHPADGYYKLDVYAYYALTFLLPLVVGRQKRSLIARV